MFAVTRPRPTFVRLFAAEKNDDLRHVGDVHEVKVAKSFEASAKGVQAIVDYDNLSDMFYARNIAGAYAQSRIDELVARWNDSIPQLIEDTTLAGARVGLQQSPGASLGYTFNLVNPRAVAWAREHSSQFLSGVNERSQKAIQAVIAEALSAGMDPREAALLVGQALGLSEKDAAALVKYRKQLEADKNPNVTRMTQRYANRLLRQRGENIARTETMAAANEGARQLWQDLFDRDLLNNNEWERSWLVAPDERVCPLCRPLHQKRADVDGVFEGGFQSPPRHSRCRCTHVLQRRDVPPVIARPVKYDTDPLSSGVLDAVSAAWRKTLTPDDLETLTLYVQNQGVVNYYLRNHLEQDDYVRGHVQRLDDMLARSVIPEPIVVRRGSYIEFYKDLQVGDTFVDDGFVSTTIGKPPSSSTVQLTIRVPAGSHGAYIEGLVPNSLDEQEVLLPRSSKFKVLAVEPAVTWADVAKYELELIP